MCQPGRLRLEIPDPSLILLVGAAGAGKSTLARRHFRRTEILSSDELRGWVSDDDDDQASTDDAFSVLHLIVEKRLARGRLTVVDATSTQVESRASLLDLARLHDVPAIAIVLDVPPEVCDQRNTSRPGRRVSAAVVRSQLRQIHRSVGSMQTEGFRHVHVLSLEDADRLELERVVT
jgi:protein phosphatase